MDICHIDKLQPELLLAIFLLAIFEDVAESAPSYNDLFSCILVNRRWHALGLGLLWESRHINFRFGKEKRQSLGFPREFIRDGFDLKQALAYLCMPHGTQESFNEPLLFRTRFLSLYLSDRKASAEENLAWPIFLAFISRCSKVRHLELTISLTKNCSRRSRALQSDLVTHLSGRTFETFELIVNAYCHRNESDNTYDDGIYDDETNDDDTDDEDSDDEYIDPATGRGQNPPLQSLAHLVTDLKLNCTEFTPLTFHRLGKLSSFKNLRHLRLYDQNRQGVTNTEFKRFWHSISNLPKLWEMTMDESRILNSILVHDRILARLPHTLTSVNLYFEGYETTNVILSNLPNLRRFLGVEISTFGETDTPINWAERVVVDPPNVACKHLESYAIFSLRAPPSHWKAVISQCRFLKMLRLPQNIPDAITTLAVTTLHSSLTHIMFLDKTYRRGEFPLHSLVWCTNLRYINLHPGWARHLDQLLVSRLCEANLALEKICFSHTPSFAFSTLRITYAHVWKDLSKDVAVAEETPESLAWYRFLSLMTKREHHSPCIYIDKLRPFLRNELWKTKLVELESQ
jgi:hypothetical protein